MVTPITLPSVVAGLLVVDWSSPVEIEHSYDVAIVSSATTIAEERRLLREKPDRTLRGRVLATSRLGGERLRMAARRLAESQQPWPLWCDVRRLSATAAAGSNVAISVDTTYARFMAGQRVWVWDETANEATNAELCVVTAKTDSSVTVAALATSRTARSFIAPSIDLDIQHEGGSESLSGYYGASSMALDELPGLSAFPPLDSYPPAGFATFGGVPILEVDIDWSLEVRRGVRREGYSQKIGRAEHRYGIGPPRETIEFSMTMPNRAESWEVFRFIDSLQGRTRPFWVVAPEERYAIAGSGSGYVDVQKLDDFDDIDTIEFVAFVVPGGEVPYILTITGKTNLGATWRLSTSTSFTLPSVVTRMSDAYKVRLLEDRWVERWLTDGIGRATITCIELIEEKDVEAADMPAEF